MPGADAVLATICESAAFMLRAICGNCGRVLVGDRDFRWWVHLETGEKGCGFTTVANG